MTIDDKDRPNQVTLSPIETKLIEAMNNNLDIIVTNQMLRDLMLRIQHNYELSASCAALAGAAYREIRSNGGPTVQAELLLVELQMLVSTYFTDPDFSKKHRELVDQVKNQSVPELSDEVPTTEPPKVDVPEMRDNVIRIQFGRKPNPEG